MTRFARVNAVYLKELDYFKIMRGIFSVDISAWTPGLDAKGVYAKLCAKQMAESHTKCRGFQEVGGWVMDVLWTELLARGGEIRANVAYKAVPNWN